MILLQQIPIHHVKQFRSLEILILKLTYDESYL